jgi:hypothetical protein
LYFLVIASEESERSHEDNSDDPELVQQLDEPLSHRFFYGDEDGFQDS